MLLLIVAFLSFSSYAQAKSFTIDEVQIDAWIKPNGDVVMNEMFTYSLDGTFSRVTRSFPMKYSSQIKNFEAYVLTNSKATMDALTWDDIERLQSSFSQTTAEIPYEMKDERVTFYYRYILTGAVKTYDTYSDLDMLLFEDGKNHATDLNNVTMRFMLPEAVDQQDLHGFIHSQDGRVQEVTSEKVTLYTPNSKAYTVTSTRLFFPSSVMTEQVRQLAPMSLQDALQQENNKLLVAAKLEGKRTEGLKLVEGATIFLALILLIALLFRFRFFGLLGSTQSVIDLDPLYISFVNRHGRWHLKSFLAGLFSLVEKGVAEVRMDQSDPRFTKQDNAPDKTLAFAYKATTRRHLLLPIEQKLVSWIFPLGNDNFHLHDIAGRSTQQVRRKKAYEKKQQKFEEEHDEWHEEVVELLEEAGSISRKKARWIKMLLIFIIGSLSIYGIWVMTDEENEWTVLIALLVILISLLKAWKSPFGRKNWVGFIVMIIMASQYEFSEMVAELWLLNIIGLLLMLMIPFAIPTTIHALVAQWSMAKFRRKIRRGVPPEYTTEQAEKWMVRAYLLQRSSKMPKIHGQLAQSSPIALLFALPEDPLKFVESTWTGPRLTSDGSSWFTGSGGDGGGYSGGGGGGDGGGGAGAD